MMTVWWRYWYTIKIGIRQGSASVSCVPNIISLIYFPLHSNMLTALLVYRTFKQITDIWVQSTKLLQLQSSDIYSETFLIFRLKWNVIWTWDILPVLCDIFVWNQHLCLTSLLWQLPPLLLSPLSNIEILF